MEIHVRDSLSELSPESWNRLGGAHNPTLSHEFLYALESNGCVGERFGWYPRIFTVHDDDGTLIGAAPAYIKDNSYGEFVFDWAWADAYQRHGIEYYPKLVVAVPFTPATGHRLLVAPNRSFAEIGRVLHDGVMHYCEREKLTGAHFLFADEGDADLLAGKGMLRRMGCQYHWYNQDYENFDDFLAGFNARKRKKVKRERRRVVEQGVQVEIVHGDEMTASQWRVVHDFYLATYERKWGFPTLNLGFFCQLGETLGRQVVISFARHEGEYVASALMLRGTDTLYGRVWGCRQHFHSLHFEACYYQGIEYCIREGLARFEPGAQGEHKIARGFRPTPTWSTHWLAEPAFHDAIDRFLAQERTAMRQHCDELTELLPFRQDG